MKLVESILVNNPCYTAGRKIAVKGLMLHSVGCPQPSANVFIRNWNKSSYGNACVHGFIDANDGTVYQTLPWDHRGWHCGYSGNDTHIGVEMCEPATIRYTTGANFTILDKADAVAAAKRTYVAATELFAFLCKKYNLDPMKKGVIVSHAEGNKLGIASNHGDPDHLWRGLGLNYTMDTFRAEVKRLMGGAVAPQEPEVAPSVPNTKFPEAPFIVQVLIPDLNYRSLPSFDGEVKGQTGQSKFTITQVLGEWGKLKSGAGWIYLSNPEYVKILETVKTTNSPTKAPASYKVRVEVDALNIRAGAGTSYKVTGIIRNRGVYTIVETNGNWGKLKSGAGWICLDYVKRA